MMLKILKVPVLAFALSVTGIAAYAQTCAGVEARVNVRTSSLVTSVTGTIASATTSYTTQQTLERSQIMSGLRVLAEQSGVSLEQDMAVEEATAKALGQTFVEQSTARQMAEVAEEFGHTGYDACGVAETASSLAEASVNAQTVSASIHAEIMEQYSDFDGTEFDDAMGDWNDIAQTGTDLSVQNVLDGDSAAATAFTKLILGPPTPPAEGGGTASGLARVIQMQETARRSAVAKVYADVAAEREVSDRLADLQDIWIGDDGGEMWAASMAASPDRAVLLDLARIEAANIAASAIQLRRAMREEFALAVHTLTEVDRRVSDWDGVGGAN
jgi:hypothetical protein